MKTVKLGWGIFNSPLRWFIVWVDIIVLTGIGYSSYLGSIPILAASFVLLLAWSTFIAIVAHSIGTVEAQRQVKTLSESNGHNRRSVIVIFDEDKKDNDKST